jgi:hypothetical protein
VTEGDAARDVKSEAEVDRLRARQVIEAERETEARVVHLRQRLVVRFDRLHGHDRSEGLGAHELRSLGHVGEEVCFEEAALV